MRVCMCAHACMCARACMQVHACLYISVCVSLCANVRARSFDNKPSSDHYTTFLIRQGALFPIKLMNLHLFAFDYKPEFLMRPRTYSCFSATTMLRLPFDYWLIGWLNDWVWTCIFHSTMNRKFRLNLTLVLKNTTLVLVVPTNFMFLRRASKAIDRPAWTPVSSTCLYSLLPLNKIKIKTLIIYNTL